MQRLRSFVDRIRQPHVMVLATILVAGFGLRIFGFNWDQGLLLHPDEFHVADVTSSRITLPLPLDLDTLLDPSISTLNPRSDDGDGRPRQFAYGTLPLYVTDVVAEGLNRANDTGIGAWLIPGPADRDWHALSQVFKVGRALGMMLDTITIALCFLIGRDLAGRRAGLFAAATYAFTPLAVQLAHFYTTDTWLTFFIAVCILASAKAARNGGGGWFLLAGCSVGLAAASKPSGFALAGLLAVAIAYDVWRRWRGGEPLGFAFAAVPERFALAGFGTLVAFGLFEPYALLSPTPYIRDFQEQSAIQRGTLDFPYTRQYVGTTPLMYHFDQLIRWGMGPVGGLFGLAGAAFLAIRAWNRRGAVEIMLLAWLVGYLVIMFIPESKFMRYSAALLPVLAVTAGLAIDQALRAMRRSFGRTAGLAVAAITIVALALWATASAAVYASEHPRIAASKWMYDHAPPGTVFSRERWDGHTAPLGLGPGLNAQDRQFEWLDFDSYGDRPNFADLLLVADALADFAPAADAALTLQNGDHQSASQILRGLTPAVVESSQSDREAAASRLEAAADAMGPTSSQLQARTRDAAQALRDIAAPAELTAARWSIFADEIFLSGEEETATAIYRQLESVDYYVISSNRITSAVPQLPWRYPVQIAFFNLLTAEQLGFELEAEFTSRPRLGPLVFNDDNADESWLNYDHPRVLVYEKVALPSKSTYDAMLAEARVQPTSPTRDPPDEPLMLDRPVGELPVVNDARWSAGVTDNSAIALAVWVVMLVVLQAVGLPIARLVLGRMADGGWVFSRLLTILLAAYIVWLGASLRVIEFRAVWCAVAVLLVAIVAFVARRGSRRSKHDESREADQRHVRLAGELVFWGVFGLFLLFRYINPDSWHWIWGGEKPMEFAHLNATLRSPHFPPYDPWFSDGIINYYYYGLYIVAFLCKLTGIPSEIAFNLAQPTIVALFASAGFGLAATLGRDLARRVRTGWKLTVLGGLLGTLLLVGIGNLTGFFGYIRKPANGVGDGFGYYTWDGSRAIAFTITEFPYFTALYADLHAHVVALPMTLLVIALAYALAKEPRSLVLSLSRGRAAQRERMVLLARLGLLALVLGSLAATNAWDVPVYALLAIAAALLATTMIRPLAVRLIVAAVIAGSTGVLAAILMAPFYANYVALFGSVDTVRGVSDFWEFSSHLGGLFAIAIVGMVVVLVSGAKGTLVALAQPIPSLLVITVLLALTSFVASDRLAQDASGFMRFAVIGVVVTVSVMIAGAIVVRAADGDVSTTGRSILRIGAVGGLVACVGITLSGREVMGMAVALAMAGTLSYFHGRSIAERYVGLTVAGAAGLVATLEAIYLVDNLAGGDWYRMNTIFKFYNQVWVLIAVASAALLTRMIAEADLGVPRWDRMTGGRAVNGLIGSQTSETVIAPEDTNRVASGTERDGQSLADESILPPPARGWSRAGLGIALLVISLSAFYPVLATQPRLVQRFTDDVGSGTLNALDWMNYAAIGSGWDCTSPPYDLGFESDRAVIEWFNQHVAGSPVVAEASIGAYRCNGSRISIGTGLPTIIGWLNHQTQQRYSEGLREREADVERLYDATDPAEKLTIIRRYGVEYVVVGELERNLRVERRVGNTVTMIEWADPEGLATFETMVGTDLEVAFQHGDTIVYRVVTA